MDSVGRPRFTIVTAVYNVSRYLDDFIVSIEEQALAPERLEIVAVDDGSTDDSLEMLRAWASRSDYRVTVLSKENGGQGSARNAGLAVATGEWVTFTDPDDMLSAGYLQIVDDYLAGHPDVAMVATNRVYLDESTGALRNGHPLRKMFTVAQSVDIDGLPDFFHNSAATAFLRLDQIRAADLDFDVRIQPIFEDGHFLARYLLRTSPRIVAFLPDAQYIYRRRSDLTSTLNKSLIHSGRFTSVIEFGYIGAMEDATALLGHVPEWLQNLIIYDLSWYFSSEDKASGSPTAAVGPVADAFHALMPRLVSFLDPTVVKGHQVRRYLPIWRDVLLHSWVAGSWRGSYAVAAPVDRESGLVRIVYRYVGQAPAEEFRVGGRIVPPRHSKVRSVVYFDRTVMHERIAWVSTGGSVRLRLDGHPVPIRLDWEGAVPLEQTFTQGVTRTSPTVPRRLVRAIGARLPGDPLRSPSRAAAKIRGEFRGAWVLVDRINGSGESAEVLFKYLRTNRPDINAWFALEEGTRDWERLVQEGCGDRLVAWGSARWESLMANCSRLIASSADDAIQRAPQVTAFTKPRWKSVLLQHGSMTDDLSMQLDRMDLALVIPSTTMEYRFLAGDGSRSSYTTMEVQNTGLPHFDALQISASHHPNEQRDLVLVAPQWRDRLRPPLELDGAHEGVQHRLWESEWAQNWMALLSSERLRRSVEERGLRLGFLPHRSLAGILDEGDLPEHVSLLPVDADVRSLLVRTACLTTDYSSLALDAAYLDRPVTYFQFDAARVVGERRLMSGGYFAYERDGFGPVAYQLEDAIENLVAVLERGNKPAATYADRVHDIFPTRDGNACRRVTAAIEAIGKPLRTSDQVTAVPTPRAMT